MSRAKKQPVVATRVVIGDAERQKIEEATRNFEEWIASDMPRWTRAIDDAERKDFAGLIAIAAESYGEKSGALLARLEPGALLSSMRDDLPDGDERRAMLVELIRRRGKGRPHKKPISRSLSRSDHLINLEHGREDFWAKLKLLSDDTTDEDKDRLIIEVAAERKLEISALTLHIAGKHGDYNRWKARLKGKA